MKRIHGWADRKLDIVGEEGDIVIDFLKVDYPVIVRIAWRLYFYFKIVPLCKWYEFLLSVTRTR